MEHLSYDPFLDWLLALLANIRLGSIDILFKGKHSSIFCTFINYAFKSFYGNGTSWLRRTSEKAQRSVLVLGPRQNFIKTFLFLFLNVFLICRDIGQC